MPEKNKILSEILREVELDPAVLEKIGFAGRALFTDYLEEGQEDLLDLVSMESFSQGYRLGARLMLSALTDSDLPFPVNT